MDSLALLKKAANADSFLKFDDLEIGKKYPVDCFELVNTNFGARIAAYIDGDMLYLPKRFTKIIKAENIEALNSKKHVIIYSGKDATRGNRVLVDFAIVKETGANIVDGDDGMDTVD